MDIVIASNNKNKLREMRKILASKFDNIYSLEDLGIIIDVEETENTFLGNARLKAEAVCKVANMNALADDSGLLVDALNGEPGVFSARYASVDGKDAKDADNNAKLLQNLVGKSNRQARFCSSVVLCKPNGEIISAEGFVEGEILLQPMGESGFGYDPLFFSTELQKSFGEATETEKNSISHRARALALLVEKL